MHGPSLCGPSVLWAECAMGRVCYGPRCPVTVWVGLNSEMNLPFAKGSFFPYEMKFFNTAKMVFYFVFMILTTRMKIIYVFK